MRRNQINKRRGTVLLMVVVLLSMLFVLLAGYLALARFDIQVQNQVEQADQIDRIVDRSEEIILDLALAQWVDPETGKITYTNDGYQDIPGMWDSNWMAGDPIWAPKGPSAAGNALIGQVEDNGDDDVYETLTETMPYMRFLAMSMYGDGNGGVGPDAMSMLELMPNADDSPDVRTDEDAQDDVFGVKDAFVYAQSPRFDADGNGVPDAIFSGSARLTAELNALAGSPITLPSDLSTLHRFDDDGDTQMVKLDAEWRAYYDDVRYEFAGRIRPLGGCVSMALYQQDAVGRDEPIQMPTGWFSLQMTRWLLDGGQLSVPQEDLLLQAKQVEGALRYRGGMQSHGAKLAIETNGSDLSAHPASVLGLLEVDNTLGEYFWDDKIMQVGRYSVTGENSVTKWCNTQVLSAEYYNDRGEGNGPRCNRRNWFTMFNWSADVARTQEPMDAARTYHKDCGGSWLRAKVNTNELGLAAGALKFNLFDIDKAFTPAGHFNTNPCEGDGSVNVGEVIIRRLADYYYDMLAGLDKGSWYDSGDKTKTTVSRLDQAFMLAVNTVAFAAPYIEDSEFGPGFIDAVKYEMSPTKVFYGYAPQPFITQVTTYRVFETDASGSEVVEDIDLGIADSNKMAIAVELYNPYDKPLNLAQYAVSVNHPASKTVQENGGTINNLFLLRSLPGDTFGETCTLHDSMLSGGIIPSRYAVVLLIKHSGIEKVNSGISTPALSAVTSSSSIMAEDVAVHLWRRGKAHNADELDFYVVDSMQVDDTKFELKTTGGDDHGDPATVSEQGLECLSKTYRDGSAEAFLEGGDARWRFVTAFEPDTSFNAERQTGYYNLDSGSVQVEDPISVDVLDDGLSNVLSPSVTKSQPSIPLYTMNASGTEYDKDGLGTYDQEKVVWINGAARPKSFPTVGFMAFIPRFSHGYMGWKNEIPSSSAPSPGWVPMSVRLTSELYGRKFDVPADGSDDVPLDFGHMPLFDNNQAVTASTASPKGFFGDDVKKGGHGAIPWGQLVFDYFTTFDPERYVVNNDDVINDENVDPYRIPGRININVAPWYVLAGLPFIVDRGSGDVWINELKEAGASDAFWDQSKGVLFGKIADVPFGSGTVEVCRNILGVNPVEYNVKDDQKVEPHLFDNTKVYRLGGYLGQAIASYRDQIPYYAAGQEYNRYWNADERPDVYPVDEDATNYPLGRVRKDDKSNTPLVGFLTVGELLNVKGFDSTVYRTIKNSGTIEEHILESDGDTGVMMEDVDSDSKLEIVRDTTVREGDFVRAVSLLALLDTHYLTTNSNTFMAYSTIMDRENPQGSVHSEMLFDRTPLIPRAQYEEFELIKDPGRYKQGMRRLWVLKVPTLERVNSDDASSNYVPSVMVSEDAKPSVLFEKRMGYFNTTMDE